jgi:hypothetical protein
VRGTISISQVLFLDSHCFRLALSEAPSRDVKIQTETRRAITQGDLNDNVSIEILTTIGPVEIQEREDAKYPVT